MLRRLLYVAYFLEVGLLLILIPWSTFWDGNYFVGSVPFLQDLLRNNFVRGAVTGLGIVNLGIGLAELAALMSARRSMRLSGGGGPNTTIEPGLPTED